jgi:hypothetical protein
MGSLLQGKCPSAWWLVVAFTAGAAGCGRPDGGVERLPVYGTVTRGSGEEISGSISFLPPKGQPAPAAVTSLVDGQYRFDRSDGPTAGPHRVVITRKIMKGQPEKQAGGAQATAAGPKSPARQPPRIEWTRSADVPAKGPYEFNFQVD